MSRKRQRQEEDLDAIALRRQSSSARQSNRLRARNATGAAAEPLLGSSQLGGAGYSRGAQSGQHHRVPSFGDPSLNYHLPA